MFQKLYDMAKWVFTFGQQTTKNQKDVEELQEEIGKLTNALQHMLFEQQRLRDEIQHLKEGEAKDRENLLLRLENEMLKLQRSLPAPKEDE